MAEQTVEAGSIASVVVNVVDSNGDHVIAVIDQTTTRLQKGDASDTTWNSVAPTSVDTIATGVYRIRFTNVSPELALTDNDEAIRLKINGTIAGVAWSEYHMPLRVVPATPRAVVKGEVDTGTTLPTTSQFSTTATTDEPYEGRTLVFTSGNNEHLAVKITGTSIVSGQLSLAVETHDGSAMPLPPADGDTFEVI